MAISNTRRSLKPQLLPVTNQWPGVHTHLALQSKKKWLGRCDPVSLGVGIGASLLIPVLWVTWEQHIRSTSVAEICHDWLFDQPHLLTAILVISIALGTISTNCKEEKFIFTCFTWCETSAFIKKETLSISKLIFAFWGCILNSEIFISFMLQQCS